MRTQSSRTSVYFSVGRKAHIKNNHSRFLKSHQTWNREKLPQPDKGHVCKWPRTAKQLWKEQSWRTYTTWFQDSSKGYSSQGIETYIQINGTEKKRVEK